MTHPTAGRRTRADAWSIGPDGTAGERRRRRSRATTATSERHVTDLVEQPAKVMRIGSMIQQLLEEVKAAPLDEASRARLREIHDSSITELEERPRARAGRRARAALPPVRRGRTPDRGRAADRPGPARRLARGPVPRHPDRDLRPADGRPRPARADAPRAPARGRAPACTAEADNTERRMLQPGAQGGIVPRTATSGQQALEHLRHAVVVDVLARVVGRLHDLRTAWPIATPGLTGPASISMSLRPSPIASTSAARRRRARSADRREAGGLGDAGARGRARRSSR